jgi:hypothetical protein
MKPNFRGLLTAFIYVLVTAGFTFTAGCASDSYAAKGAGQGAATGAMAGAVGGMITALVFGGDVAEAGARGAVYGGATGAVAGGISGSNVDKKVAAQEQAQRDADLERFRAEVGTDAYNGVVALAECKHEIAIANAREAAQSKNRDHALAGIWVVALAEADRQREQEARAMFPEIIARDGEVDTEADAEKLMREALQELGEIRVEYDLPARCSN